ncbi:MAG: thiosulfate sulfurtransferase [Verrucomicrobiaceae bacterium]|nr:thiosulfate sulfurtransferase [Verrucomicrobiaceae bacterium]
MTTFKHLSAENAQTLLQQGAALIDIRDEASFAQGHIQGALRLDNSNVGTFIDSANKDTALIVCCYHGISSQSAAQFFSEQGFAEVYSLDGGFEECKNLLPVTI